MAQRIAIIEDEPSIRQLYDIKLSKDGYEVFTAQDGVSGLIVCEKVRPHLILLDLLMPEMNGDEMLNKLRATDWGKDIKVIILTNVSRQEAPESLNILNINRYIVKAEYTAQQVSDIVKSVFETPS